MQCAHETGVCSVLRLGQQSVTIASPLARMRGHALQMCQVQMCQVQSPKRSSLPSAMLHGSCHNSFPESTCCRAALCTGHVLIPVSITSTRAPWVKVFCFGGARRKTSLAPVGWEANVDGSICTRREPTSGECSDIERIFLGWLQEACRTFIAGNSIGVLCQECCQCRKSKS